jgi:hypothetical protein
MIDALVVVAGIMVVVLISSGSTWARTTPRGRRRPAENWLGLHAESAGASTPIRPSRPLSERKGRSVGGDQTAAGRRTRRTLTVSAFRTAKPAAAVVLRSVGHIAPVS